MKFTVKYLSIVLFLSISVLCISFGGQKAEWKGKIEVEDGVKVIKNPKEPMYGEDVFGLEEELSIETKEISQTEETFQKIVSLAIDDKGNIFILDKKAGNIKIFDKNGKSLKTIGRKGEGPGEFGAPERCAFTPNNELYVYDSGRRIIHIFNIDGEFKREVPVSMPFFEGPKFTSKGEIIASHGVMGEKPFFELKKFDSEMSPILSFTSIPMLKPPKVHVFVYLTASDLKWDVSSRDEIIWGIMTTPEYELFVHNEDGKYIKRITKEFTPVKLSKKEYKKLMTKWFGKVPTFDRWDLIIPDNYPPFQLFIVDDEGRIFVKRFMEVEKSDNHHFDVFDEEGKYITNIILDSKFQFGIFKNKKLFSIEEDEDGYQYVKRYKVTWKY
ncbi:MAG: 6-bladed beta-propeller [Candidatus Aminicenantes bacterium]|nr:6-bladed beta-propeller [Candidatus Aminicenantes bacterium]MDH5706472.1 6-bladed beta-propeller [Candidatus Aminicenantes bacterium]